MPNTEVLRILIEEKNETVLALEEVTLLLTEAVYVK